MASNQDDLVSFVVLGSNSVRKVGNKPSCSTDILQRLLSTFTLALNSVLLTRLAMSSLDPSQAVEFVSQIELTQYTQIAVLAVLIYDIIITMGEEVEYFWSRSLSPTNLAFFFIRYSALLGSILSQYHLSTTANTFIGKFYDWGGSISDWIIILCMDYILYLRIRAVYSFETPHRKIVMSIRILYGLNATISLANLVYGISKANSVTAFAYNGLKVCVDNNPVVWARSVYWSAPLCYETILLCLGLYKAMEIRKSLGFRGLSLLKTIIYDQVAYFVLVMICSIANIVPNIVVELVQRSSFLSLFYILGSASMISLLGSRMLLHLKKAAGERLEGGDSFRISSNLTIAEFRVYTARQSRFIEGGERV
ncbi:uncharacterized protein FOMMEDRAFT_145679 [Fomitiporia mediterranea MF3/22]|uniref:uncharacterized protein n=1 Tax=Fomitiporia mediterranea (strain MF3/22) TaxID=694068 RepID=UPI000440798D|nr:uncharacterized protein FOMMEDRAFT_145679 [Fomitiporia mediterranea MF3/22]EJD05029.1 hypothetical protein FOMMEDRAFT_145679 [Fomitiporia mediterranea MF3/22]